MPGGLRPKHMQQVYCSTAAFTKENRKTLEEKEDVRDREGIKCVEETV